MLPLRYVLESRIGHTTVTGPAATVYDHNNMHQAYDSVNFALHGDAVSPDGLWSKRYSATPQ